jgi:putative peptide zinc metalloprotease protein
MSLERHDLRTFWADEEDVVPILGTVPTSAASSNGALVHARSTPPPRLTAADFTPERMLRPRARPPADGWRRTVYRATGGMVAVGPNAAERRRRELIAQVQTPIRGCRTVAFVSRKGGVGKTTTCLLAGHTFALHRGDRVVAVDANPDAGTLGHRLRRETQETIATLLHDRAVLARYADVRAYSSQAESRLEVIAGDDRPDAQGIERAAVHEAVALLESHYNLVLLDTPAGVLNSATQGVLDAADQLVLVSPTGLDGARAASSTLDWLEHHGHEELVASAVAALNNVRGERGDVDLDRIEEHFASRCRACVRVPWDAHIETGAEVELRELRPATRDALLKLAALIAGGFSEPLERRSDPCRFAPS